MGVERKGRPLDTTNQTGQKARCDPSVRGITRSMATHGIRLHLAMFGANRSISQNRYIRLEIRGVVQFDEPLKETFSRNSSFIFIST